MGTITAHIVGSLSSPAALERTFSYAKRRQRFEDELISESIRGRAKAMRDVKNTGDPMALLNYVLAYFPSHFADACCMWDLTVSLGERPWFDGVQKEITRQGRLPKGAGKLVGLFDPLNMAVSVVNGIRIESTYPQRWQSTVDVLGHELCHFADWSAGEPSAWDEDFLACYAMEDDMLPLYEASSPNEFFATAGWICLRYPRQAKIYIPETFGWFEDFWREHGVYGEFDSVSRYKATSPWQGRERKISTIQLACA